MQEKFGIYRNKISEFVSSLFESKKSEAGKINQLGEELTEKLSRFVLSGKMIRGCLVLLSYEMFKEEISEEAIKVAAAIELLHSALLIHDDIIDKDELRRGAKTIFSQYEELGKKENLPDARHFGYSVGICAGDLCISYAYQILSSLNVEDSKKMKVISLFCDGLNVAGFAEIDDVYLGLTDEEAEEDRIMSVYKHKTAIYTFSVPFSAGAILADAKEEDNKALYKIGEKMGIIFQIKDDEMGIFGEEEEIGKPTGSDISENKKTLWRHYIFAKALDEEKSKLKEIFGKESVSLEEVQLVRNMINEKGVREQIDKLVETLDKESRELVKDMNIPEYYKLFLIGLMNYNLKRNK